MAASIAGALWQRKTTNVAGGAFRSDSSTSTVKSMTRLLPRLLLGPAWFRIPSWLGLASPGAIKRPIPFGHSADRRCINMAIRTYETNR